VAATSGAERSFETVEQAGPFDAVSVALELPPAEGLDLRRRAARVFAKPSTVFLLVDVEQPGATESQLHRSDLLDVLPRGTAVVVVAQGVKGLVLVRELAPALLELKRILRRLGVAPPAVLVNDDAAWCSALADRLVCGEPPRTNVEEQRWIAEIGGEDLIARRVVGETLRAWRGLEEA
jgi:hypothetical protein